MAQKNDFTNRLSCWIAFKSAATLSFNDSFWRSGFLLTPLLLA
jgi:hypothetical protein